MLDAGRSAKARAPTTPPAAGQDGAAEVEEAAANGVIGVGMESCRDCKEIGREKAREKRKCWGLWGDGVGTEQRAGAKLEILRASEKRKQIDPK